MDEITDVKDTKQIAVFFLRIDTEFNKTEEVVAFMRLRDGYCRQRS
jgi:hypothetical protein